MRLLTKELINAGVDHLCRPAGDHGGAAGTRQSGDRIVHRGRWRSPGEVLARPLHPLDVASLGRAGGQGHPKANSKCKGNYKAHSPIIARSRQGHKASEVTQ